MSSRTAPALFFRALSLTSVALFVGCGSYNSNPSSTPVSNVKERIFVANASAEELQIVDASNDTLSTFTIAVSGTPTQLLESKNKATTVAYDSAGHGVDVIDNATETQTVTAQLADAATSLALAPGGGVLFAAIPTATCSVTPPTVVPPGAVAVVNTGTGAVTNCVAIANAQGLSLSHNGSVLLVFARGSNQVSVINTGNLKLFVPTISDPKGQLDNPVAAVFSSNDSTAYILSCGPECGGTTASVTSVTTSSNVLGPSVPVTAAREGLLNGSTLYVAGSTGGAGSLEVINASALTVQKTVAISDGVHDTITLSSNGKLFIGAHACSNTAHGCLSMFDTAAGTVTFSPANVNGDDITGMEPIPGRNVIYVCEGGEVIIYDTTTDAPQMTQFDIVGNAADAREVF